LYGFHDVIPSGKIRILMVPADYNIQIHKNVKQTARLMFIYTTDCQTDVMFIYTTDCQTYVMFIYTTVCQTDVMFIYTKRLPD